MDFIKAFFEIDLSDPINLLPLVMVAMIAIYIIAIFFDQPPQ